MKDKPATDPNRSPNLPRLSYGVVWLMLSIAVLSACERRAARPTLELNTGSGPNSFSFSVGESVLFGLGPFMAQGGEIRIESAQVKGMKGAELKPLSSRIPPRTPGASRESRTLSRCPSAPEPPRGW